MNIKTFRILSVLIILLFCFIGYLLSLIYPNVLIVLFRSIKHLDVSYVYTQFTGAFLLRIKFALSIGLIPLISYIVYRYSVLKTERIFFFLVFLRIIILVLLSFVFGQILQTTFQLIILRGDYFTDSLKITIPLEKSYQLVYGNICSLLSGLIVFIIRRKRISNPGRI